MHTPALVESFESFCDVAAAAVSGAYVQAGMKSSHGNKGQKTVEMVRAVLGNVLHLCVVKG